MKTKNTKLYCVFKKLTLAINELQFHICASFDCVLHLNVFLPQCFQNFDHCIYGNSFLKLTLTIGVSSDICICMQFLLRCVYSNQRLCTSLNYVFKTFVTASLAIAFLNRQFHLGYRFCICLAFNPSLDVSIVHSTYNL